MKTLALIPEIRELTSQADSIRIPGELNVPISGRVRRLIDTPEFQRLRHVSQLGLVGLVYPGATHSRFEHSLGVYRLGLHYVARLTDEPAFAGAVQPREALAFLVATLVHDVGHWPFCHPLEDLRLPEIQPHESLACRALQHGDMGNVVRDAFGLEPDDVVRLLQGEPRSDGECILSSLLSSPIDVDKMDYLFRDSLHAGVPYGRNYDGQRLIDSLCVGGNGKSLAITDKGRTAAEMMVFARYIMFSEVYWHHAVRAATAMLQRAFYDLRERLDVAVLQQTNDAQFLDRLSGAAREEPLRALVAGLFGPTRRLYKRWMEFNFRDDPQLFRHFARRPYEELRAASLRLSEAVGRKLKRSVPETAVLIDAPPAHLEIQFNLDVWHPRRKEFRTLAELSPVVAALATNQFDDLVKRVRVFVAPELREAVAQIADPPSFIAELLC